MKTKEQHIVDLVKTEAENTPPVKSELGIWLDNYNDIFSDFDPRPLNERRLSDDFLHEVRKRIHEKDKGKIELRLLVPAAIRNKETEAIITRHLHAHFKYEVSRVKINKQRITQKGWLLTLFGIIIMIGAAWLLGLDVRNNFTINVIRVITEPAGWFMVWTGLDQVFYTTQKINPELEFYERMNKSEISFWSY